MLGALILLGGPAVAQQAPATTPPGAGALPDRPVRAPSTPTTMPFTLQDNLLRIDARVNGQRISAVLDSGAGAIITDQAVIRRLGLKEATAANDAAGAGAAAQSLHEVALADLRFGPFRFRNVPSYAGDLSQLSQSARFPVDMLVGAPAFKYGAVTVDYPRRRITFGPSGSAGRCADPIPLEILNDAPVVTVAFRPTPTAPAVRLKMLVDLGTRHSALMIGGSFLRTKAGQALVRSGVARQIGHGVGGKVQGTVARVSEMRLGRAALGAMDVGLSPDVPAFESGIVDGTLGVPLWEDGVITFDYPARRLCIAKSGQG